MFRNLWQPTGVQIPFELRILFHVSPNCRKLLVRAVKPTFSSFIKVYLYNKRNISMCLGRQMETVYSNFFTAKIWTRVSEKLKKTRAQAGLVKSLFK
jgi:hypothetical protein